MYTTLYKYFTIIFRLFIAFVPLTGTMSQHSLVSFDYPINTDNYDEIAPVMSYDEDKIFFTRIGSPDFHPTLLIDSIDVHEIFNDTEYRAALQKVYRQIAGKDVHDVVSSSFNQDIWIIHLDDSFKATDLSHPGYPLNDALPNSICARLDDHGRFILLNQFERIGGLDKGFSVTQMIQQDFSFPESINLEGFHTTHSRVHLCSSADQKVFILSLPNEEGNMDLFVSFRLYDRFYSRPVPLDEPANTSYDEMSPFLSSDGKTLYFASDRPGTKGGLDIFSMTRQDDSFLNWGEVKPLYLPVNTAFDELYPCLFDDENRILFSSGRNGSQDIFMATLKREKTIEIDINIFMINAVTKALMPAELYWGPAYEDGRSKENYFRCRDGKYRLVIKENQPIIFQAFNRNFQSQAVIIDPQEVWQYDGGKVQLDLVMNTESASPETVRKSFTETLPFEQILQKSTEKSQETESAVFRNIMFEKSTANILDRSIPTILTLGKFLKMNKNIQVEITGHTDNVGDEAELLKLSADRAEAIKNLLVKQGIPAERIVAKGAGASFPIADNGKESTRKLNRRVEIRIQKEEMSGKPSGTTF